MRYDKLVFHPLFLAYLMHFAEERMEEKEEEIECPQFVE